MVNVALTSGKPHTLEICMSFSVLLSIFNPFEDIPVQYERWYRSCTWWQALGHLLLGLEKGACYSVVGRIRGKPHIFFVAKARFLSVSLFFFLFEIWDNSQVNQQVCLLDQEVS